MVNSGKRQSAHDRFIDPADQNSDGEESVDVNLSGVETPLSSISRRLTEIFLEDSDEDLLLQMSNKEDCLLQRFQALDMQVTGACRADERLMPLLKLNISTVETEDRLLAQLGEHFEPSEVGLLTRCLCVPLVSIRVGKINKQGTLLSPTSIRGNLCLTLLPTSELRISFNGDDGHIERLATLSSEAPCTTIGIEEIAADKSGRSFLIKTTDGVYYFWCSEKSQPLGNELLREMKDLFLRRPSLAELTGISEGRLNSFATNLRTYLGGSTVVSSHSSGGLLANTSSDEYSFDPSGTHFPRSSFTCENMAYFPRSSSKEGLLESSSSFTATEKLAERVEDSVLHVDGLSLASTKNSDPSTSNVFQKFQETNGLCPIAKLSSIHAYGKPAELPLSGPKIKLPSSDPFHISPHYCWCLPLALTLEGTLVNSQPPISSTESLHLPPLSSLISAARPRSPLTSKSPLPNVPPVEFPSFMPDPLIRLPTSQQILAFTPLMCDPIVHIPVIDVCSSGPGYLVGVGPSIAPAIPPSNPNLVDPLLLGAESVVEKSARETLRMLIGNTNQTNLQLLEVLPSVLSGSDDKQNVLAIVRDDSIDKKKPFNSSFDSEMSRF